MARTQLSAKRLTETMKTNIGRIIIFCEGKTEKYYFDYFAGIINKNKYTDVEVVLETANGNAQAVLNCANKFMSNEEHNFKFSAYGKYLTFDCDAPPKIQDVVLAAKNYELLVSNTLFEVWLLMHFEDVETVLPNREIYRRLSGHLNNKYKKGNKGMTRNIVGNGNVEKAIDNVKMLEKRYADDDKSVLTSIKEMNPYTSVHRLIEQFMVEISEKNGGDLNGYKKE